MSDQPANIPLRLAVDEAALTRSQAGLSLLSQKLADIKKSAAETGATVDKATASLGDGIAKATPLMDRLAAAADKAAQSAKNATGNWNDLRDSIFSAGGAADKAGSSFSVQGLRRTGGALSQLGLGEIGGPVSKIGDIAQVGKEIGEITGNLSELGLTSVATAAPLGAAALALGGVAIAYKLFNDELQKGRDDVTAAAAGLDTYYATIRKGTQETIAAQIAALQGQLDDAKAKEAQFAEAAKSAQAQAGEVGKGIVGQIIGAFGAGPNAGPGVVQAIDSVTGATKAASDEQQKYAKIVADLTAKIEGLNVAQNSSIVAANTAADNYMKDYQLSKLSTDAAKQLLADKQAELQANNRAIQALQDTGDTSKAATDKMKDLVDNGWKLGDTIKNLNENVIPAAERMDELAEAIKKNAQAMQDRSKAAEQADKDELKRQSDIATSYQKYKNDIANIERSSAEEQAKIHQQLADKLIDEAKKAADQQVDDLRKLQDNREQLLIKEQRSETDIANKQAFEDANTQIKIQEETATRYQDHLRKLQDIQRSAWAADQQALLDRNFVALAKSRLGVATQMQSENIGFGRSEEDRSRQEQIAKQDTARQRAFEHQQRLINYERANADAVRQYQIQLRDQRIAEQRAIEAAQLTAQRELIMVQQKAQAALSLRAQQETAELKIMQQGGEARVKAEALIQQALVSQAMRFLGQATGQYGTPRSAALSVGGSGQIYANTSAGVHLTQTNNLPAGLNEHMVSNLILQKTADALQRVMG